jgi:hypothetical protein
MHNICLKCKTKIDQCPLCRKEIILSKWTAYFKMEQVYNGIPEVLKGLHLRFQCFRTTNGITRIPAKIAYPSKMHLLHDFTEYFRNIYNSDDEDDDDDDENDDDDDENDDDDEYNNIEVGEIFIPLTGESYFFNKFEVSNFRNVRNIHTRKIFRPFLENGVETVIIDEGNSSKFKFTVDQLLLFA